MNIIGEGFPEEIIEQVKQRQRRHGSGYTTTRTPEEITYLNANTSWVKLVSSVNITDKSVLQDESLRDAPGIENSSLAKQFVLFNGVNEDPSNQRSDISLDGSILGNNNAYGIGGTEFGLRPMMGIQSAEIKHENRGSIRRATVKIKAFNKTQFDIIDALYLRLGFSMLLEWGHSMYFDNNGVLQTNLDNSLSNEFLTGKLPGPKPLLTYVDFLKLIKEKQISSNGNYDAMFAKVCNFHWSFLKDGSYDITLDLVSIGDVVESFKINLLSYPPQYLKTPNDLSEKSSFEQIKFYSNQSEIGKLMYNLVKDTFDNIDNNDNNNDIAKKAKAYQESLKTPIPQISPIIYLSFTNETKPYGNFYIRLGTLLQFIEENIMYKVKTSNNSIPLLNFDYDEESNLMYIEDIQTSTDPSICVINRDININNIKNNISSLTGVPPSTINLLSPVSSDTLNIVQNKGKEFDSTLFPNLPTTYGKIMNIYVNVLWVLTKLNELKDSSNNKVILVDFIQNILSGINGSLGGTTNLEARIDETSNTLIIIDGNPLPYKDEIIDVLKNKGYNINKQYIKFDLYGYNKINGVGSTSFIKDFSFTTEITPALSTMLTVGATANSTVVGENSTSFSKFNIGLKDRFKEEIILDNERTLENIINSWGNPFSNLSLQDQLKSDQIARKSINELLIKFGSYLISYLSYLNDINKGIHNPTESESYKDILNNLITYKQQYFQAQENYLQSKGKKTTIISPSTGFIPFNLSLTMDGLSGMKIFNKFLIDTEFLPANYPDYADFIIKNITHTIANNKWDTKIESIVISRGDEYSSASQQNSPQSTTQSTPSAGNTKASKGNPSLKQVIIKAGYPEGSKEYVFAYAIGKKEGWNSSANGGVGSRSYRNNNPGNLDFSINLRKIDPGVALENNPYGSNRFAHFTTAELGVKALIENKIKRWGNGNMPVTAGNTTLIEQKKGGPQYKKGTAPTIAQFVYTYAPPNENNTELYISNLLTDLKKVKPDTTRTTLVKQFFA